MAKRPASKTGRPALPHFEVQAMILSRFDVMQYAVTEEDTERKLGLDGLVTPVSAADETNGNGGSTYYGSACFRCVREGDNERTSVHMVAMYSFAFSCETDAQDQLDLVASTVASTSVWSQFMGIFSLANAQMRARMPLLPPAPNQLQKRPMEELVDMFSVFASSEETATEPED